MATHVNGVTVDSFVAIDDCLIEYTVIAGEAELRFGPENESGLATVFSERGLVNLVATASDALHLIRAERSSAESATG